jgi:hypothetical protein
MLDYIILGENGKLTNLSRIRILSDSMANDYKACRYFIDNFICLSKYSYYKFWVNTVFIKHIVTGPNGPKGPRREGSFGYIIIDGCDDKFDITEKDYANLLEMLKQQKSTDSLRYEIARQREEIEFLKDHIMYSPGGDGYMAAKSRFEVAQGQM